MVRPRVIVPHPELGATLRALAAPGDMAARVLKDPVQFPRRYADTLDAELAGFVAASLAYGRVAAFLPAIASILARMDAVGGPGAYVRGLDVGVEREALAGWVYRWTRGQDLLWVVAALGRCVAPGGTLEGTFGGAEAGMAAALTAFVGRVREEAMGLAPEFGLRVSGFSELPRGVRVLLPSPADGSACKRWNLWLRWLVRPSGDGVDLGRWALPASRLVIPLDTHVLRISQLVGLTQRRDGSWRTALEITGRLAALDPADPVRFDFALAHLGISGGCLGVKDARVCPSCALREICRAPERSAEATPEGQP